MQLRYGEWQSVSGSRFTVGIDLVHVQDMEELISGAEGVWLTVEEWRTLSISQAQPERWAGRFAAKEAVLKVLGRGIDHVALTDIEICHQAAGKPYVRLRNSARRLWTQCGFAQLELSISHHRDYAVAAAVAWIGSL